MYKCLTKLFNSNLYKFIKKPIKHKTTAKQLTINSTNARRITGITHYYSRGYVCPELKELWVGAHGSATRFSP